MIKTYVTIDPNSLANGVSVQPVVTSFEYPDCSEYCFDVAFMAAAEYYRSHPELHSEESMVWKELDKKEIRFSLSWFYIAFMPDSVCEMFGFRRLPRDTVEFLPSNDMFEFPDADVEDIMEDAMPDCGYGYMDNLEHGLPFMSICDVCELMNEIFGDEPHYPHRCHGCCAACDDCEEDVDVNDEAGCRPHRKNKRNEQCKEENA